MPQIVWNIITRNIQPDEQTRLEIRQKLSRLEEHLKAFPADMLHLQILLEKHPKRPLHTAELTIRLPANILRVKKSAPDLMTAFDDALQIILGELGSGKGGTHRGALRKRDIGGEKPNAPENAGLAFEPQAQGSGPQNLQDVIRQFFEQNYNWLLHHARRHIRHEETTGDISAGVLDARDIVDEVARQAEAHVNRKPKKMSWLGWLFHLLHEEFRRQREGLKQEQVEAVPTDKRTTLPELRPEALQPLEQMVEEVVEPQIIHTEDVVPDPEAVPPDRFVEEKELLQHLQGAIRSWGRPEREVFELYFVQGFEPGEIAQIIRQPLKQVKGTVANVQRLIREELLQEDVRIAA